MTTSTDRPPLRWALVGASDIASSRVLPALRAIGDTAVVVRSGNAAHGQAWARDNAIPESVTDVEAAVARDDVDAVYISSVNPAHHNQVLAAASAGKHVLAEKPLALTLADAVEMVAACRAAGVVMATNHHLPAAATHQAIKRAVRDGLIGEVRSIRFHHAGQLPAHLVGWRVDDPIGGGAVLDITVHDAAAISAILGTTAIDVTATALQQDNDPDGPPDAVMTTMLWQGGVLVQTHDAYNNAHLPTGVHILGTRGAIVGDGCNGGDPVGTVTLYRDNRPEPIDVGTQPDLYETTVRAFGAAVAGEDEVIVTGEDGVRSLAVALAVQESLKTGRRTAVARIPV